MNRARIDAMLEKCGEVWLGNVNFYDEVRKAVVAKEHPVFTKWDGSLIHNFEYTIAIPRDDKELADMIRQWNGSDLPLPAKLIEKITDRVDFIGGINLTWY